ncbi:aldehyde dehydrogenase family protein [Mycolicibacterium sp.]|uniref:aldehyde dehydrogenase family protein n=1 Tax=Mycolicibacterium sp. TaxID=2320850 RepID=UPI003D0DA09D
MTISIPGLDPGPAAFTARTHRLLIGGSWLEATDARTFPIHDPATCAVITRVAFAGPDDVDRAVERARAALDGPWGTMSAAGRSAVMHRIADLMEQHGEELAQLEALDNGKPITYARAVDVASSVEWMRYFAGWPTKIAGESALVGAGESLYYSRKEPVGVCGLIVPWNYPLLIAMWKVAPALAAGCTVVLKPAEQTPLSALRFGELAGEAGLPDGVLNILTGDGSTGAAIVGHPGIDKLSFTGSTAVGREIGAKAGRALKRVTLELGGKSAGIVLPDADLESTVTGAFSGIYFNTGQSCTAASRLYVPVTMFDDVVSGIAEMAQATTPLPGLDPASTVGPVVSREQFDRVNQYIEDGIGEAELVAGGPGAARDQGWFIAPTLFTTVDDSIRIAREEIFGPVLVATPYRDLDEVIRRANESKYGLAAGLWTRDVTAAHRFAAKLDAGTVYINRWSQYGPNVPFGGFKDSGIGREHGAAGLESYLKEKSILVALS